MNLASDELHRRLTEHLRFLYPNENVAVIAEEIIAIMGLNEGATEPSPHHNNWTEKDAVLISYGDTLQRAGQNPLEVLKEFVDQYLSSSISAIHILPFFPFSSDDGFSVMDYLAVNPSLGGWDDITAIADDYKLMADLVINHMSSRSRWFENYKKRVHPGRDYFFEAEPGDDLTKVVRPRNSPLLVPVDTAEGERHVWCTFSEDQVDLNFKNPQVLIEFVNIIHEYLERGVKIFRMDAVAFLWKKVGTESIHLQETHELIKLLRTVIEYHSPDAIVITETNVPNRENLTYFGNANEAHVIYNFSLPPLLLHTLVSGDCRHLKTWMMSMPQAQEGTAYLNFIASHDGIGLRPLDGLLDDSQRDELINTMRQFGARVTMRKSRGGHEKAYELNIALFDALKGTVAGGPDHWQCQRFICAHAIMLALEGIPAFYIHSFLATENDHARVEHTGRNRSINRHIWPYDQLKTLLDDEETHHRQVFDQLRALLTLRREQPAFHPNATQYMLHLGSHVFAFWRQSIDRSQSIFCLSNVSDREQLINLSDINLLSTDEWVDLISMRTISELDSQLCLSPYQTLWLSNQSR